MLRKTKTSKQIRPLPVRSKPESLEALEPRRLLSASLSMHPTLQLLPNAHGADIQGFTPQQMAQAYGFNQISMNSALGSGQTIAIVDAYSDPSIASDLHVFDSQFGLSDPNLSVVNQDGGSASSVTQDPDWDVEISLDVEWAHAMAPGANILLVEANSDSLNDLLTAVNTARNAAGVSVVSMSWGSGEFASETSYDNFFTTPSGHQGVTFVASAGDSGAASAEWPSASPNVLSVGGTTLLTDASGNYQGESAWSDGGGGTSEYESEPSFQNGAQSTGSRTTPDVAYAADPNTGVAIYDSVNDYGYVGWQEVGGTSAGAPQWSSLVAIANQGRAQGGKSTLDGPTATMKTLYDMYSAPGTSGYASYTSNFNDITTGGGSGFGRFRIPGATPGYDEVTGLGTPKASAIVDALDGLSSRSAARLLHKEHVARRLANIARLKHVGDNPGLVQRPIKPDTTTTTTTVTTTAAEPLPVVYTLSLSGTGHIAAPDSSASLLQSGSSAGNTSVVYIEESSSSLAPIHFGVNPFAGIFAGSAGAVLGASDGNSGAGGAATGTAGSLGLADPAQAQDSADLAAQIMVDDVDLLRPATTTALADAMAAFAQECAAVTATPQGIHATRAWTVTAVVMGIDAILVGYWNARRNSKRNRKNTPAAA